MNTARKLPPVVTTAAPITESRPAFTGARAPVSEADARRRRPGTGVACLILLGITLGALGHVAVHLKHYEVALALGDARRERAALEERRRQLSLEIGVYKDPVRVMDLARTKLGLAQPSAADIVPASELGARLAMRLAGEDKAAATPMPATQAAATTKPTAPTLVPAAPANVKATPEPPKPAARAHEEAEASPSVSEEFTFEETE